MRDQDEPKHLAQTMAAMQLKYVLFTSLDRDDLRDGGAGHFVDCIREIRALKPSPQIEILVPDFRGRMHIADEFAALREFGDDPGFARVASGPPVRSSYHAEVQTHAAESRWVAQSQAVRG